MANTELFHQDGRHSLAIRIRLVLGKHDLQFYERAQAIDLIQMDARRAGQEHLALFGDDGIRFQDLPERLMRRRGVRYLRPRVFDVFGPALSGRS